MRGILCVANQEGKQSFWLQRYYEATSNCLEKLGLDIGDLH
jgi:hypothetical protein